jgi:tetratricopeptide (TPR) repeat protein
LPVLDGGRFLGMVSRQQLEDAARNGRSADTLGDLLRVPPEPVTADNFPHVHVDQAVDVVLQRMGRSGLDVLPVVSRTDVHDLLGVVALAEMPQAYGSTEGTESAVEAHRKDAASPKALLTVVVAGVLGLFLLGGFLTHHYYSARVEKAAGFYRAGTDLARDGRTGEAIEQFRAALSLTHSDDYRQALGVALARADRGAEAKIYLREVLRTDPNSGPANLAMARLSAAENDHASAVTSYRKALGGVWPRNAQPQRIDAAFELADLFEKSGDRRQAVAELLQLTGRTADPAVLNRIGLGLLAAGSPGSAADVFRQVLTASPKDAAAYAGLGDVEMAQEDYRAARTAFEQAVRLDPTNGSTRAQAALCTRVLALDPTSRGLGGVERYERTRQILKGVLSALEACSPSAGRADPNPVVGRARQVLASSRRPPSLADAIDENIRLAESLWASRSPACARAGSDEAVARVLARLAR